MWPPCCQLRRSWSEMRVGLFFRDGWEHLGDVVGLLSELWKNEGRPLTQIDWSGIF